MIYLTFQPGFRFSKLDAIVLAIGVAATVGFMAIDSRIAVAIAFVVLHFFLFCNVIRMSRPLELIWAFCFSLSCVLATLAMISWPAALGISLVVTYVVVGVETRRPSYHGVAWQRINPRLEQWWEDQRVKAG